MYKTKMIALIVNSAYYGITTICGIYLLNSLYQLVKFNNYIDYLQSNQQPRFRSEFHKIEYNEDDFNEGYDCACEEFLDQCTQSAKSPMEYVNKNLKLLDDKDKLDPQYIKSSLLLLVLPTWSITVNEVQYVVRATQKSVWTTAWVIQKDQSDELDEKLREVVLKSIPDMTDIKIDNLQRLVRKNMYQVLDDLVSVYAH